MDVASLQTYMADIDNLALVASIDNMCFLWLIRLMALMTM